MMEKKYSKYNVNVLLFSPLQCHTNDPSRLSDVDVRKVNKWNAIDLFLDFREIKFSRLTGPAPMFNENTNK